MTTATTSGLWTHDHPGLMTAIGAAVVAVAIMAMLLFTGSTAAVWDAVTGGNESAALTNGLELVNPSSREH